MSGKLAVLLARLRDEVGGAGVGALVLLGLIGAFHVLVLAPMAHSQSELAERGRRLPAAEAGAAAGGADKLSAVYGFLRKNEKTTDWLAHLHGIGAASGVSLRAASYRTVQTEGPIMRYEIAVPVSGSYPQIREFLRRALAEIPVMSVDQVSLQRRGRGDPMLQGELRMTLHMVKS
jgi:hypothetical protein